MASQNDDETRRARNAALYQDALETALMHARATAEEVLEKIVALAGYADDPRTDWGLIGSLNLVLEHLEEAQRTLVSMPPPQVAR